MIKVEDMPLEEMRSLCLPGSVTGISAARARVAPTSCRCITLMTASVYIFSQPKG